jgi:hypothetical protein
MNPNEVLLILPLDSTSLVTCPKYRNRDRDHDRNHNPKPILDEHFYANHTRSPTPTDIFATHHSLFLAEVTVDAQLEDLISR